MCNFKSFSHTLQNCASCTIKGLYCNYILYNKKEKNIYLTIKNIILHKRYLIKQGYILKMNKKTYKKRMCFKNEQKTHKKRMKMTHKLNNIIIFSLQLLPPP